MQRYKCNTKEKTHICWENTLTKNGGKYLVVKAFCGFYISIHVFKDYVDWQLSWD